MIKHHQLEAEMMAALLLHLLKQSNNPELISAALSKNPDSNKFVKLLIEHNNATHADLKNVVGPAPQAEPAIPQDSRVRKVNALLSKYGQ
jgi:hypothetical protein